MVGKRIAIRRGRAETPPVAEELSAFAKAAKDSTALASSFEGVRDASSALTGWSEAIDLRFIEGVARSMLLSPEVMGGSYIRRRSPTNPFPEPIRETAVLPEGGVTMNFAGVDPAAPGAERTAYNEVTPQQAQRWLEGNRFTTSTRIHGTYTPSLEIHRDMMAMETEICLRIYLRGPNNPPSYCVVRFRDEELRAASLSYEATLGIRREVVNRLILSMHEPLQEMLVEALDIANRNDEDFRREMSRMTGVRGRSA